MWGAEGEGKNKNGQEILSLENMRDGVLLNWSLCSKEVPWAVRNPVLEFRAVACGSHPIMIISGKRMSVE